MRQGSYLALFYALEGADFHLDNLIAVGEHPMFIDLEALFHPRDAERSLPPLERALNRATYHSVLRPGFLPEPELGDGVSSGFDLSGLAGAGGQATPYRVPRWENKGTDSVHLVRRQAIVRGSQNLPRLQGRPVNVVDYRQDITQGFVNLYRILIRRRVDFVGKGGWLSRFAKDEIRVLPRSGSFYRSLLETSFHPDLLRSAQERERYLDKWLWMALKEEATLERLIPFEKADLLTGEIPHFSTQAGSRDAFSSRRQRIQDFFPRSGLEAARRRITALGEVDLEKQSWLVQAALATAARERETRRGKMVSIPWVYAPPQDQLVELACTIGARFDETAVRAAGEASWLGVALIEDRHWEIEPLDLDLYNGLPGVILFLAYLGAVTGQERWTNLAGSAAITMERYISEAVEKEQANPTAIGALDGLGGLLYTLAHLSAVWRQPGLLESSAKLVAFANRLAFDRDDLGLASGLAGCIAGLLALHRVAPELGAGAAALKTGDGLLQYIEPFISSRTVGRPGALPQPFARFWHGRLGLSWTMSRLARLSGKVRFRQMALKLIDEELDSEEELESSGKYYVHDFAPGIAQGCLRVINDVEDSIRRARLFERFDLALDTMLEGGFGRNHSLGRGDMGNLDLLIQACTVLNDDRWQDCLARKTAEVIASQARTGWVTGIPLGVESPGLMTGTSGIGYGLLRLIDPAKVPSVLALEPPHW